MKRRLNRTLRILPLALIVTTTSTIGIGYAAWNFSQRASLNNSIENVKTMWSFSWTNNTILSEDMYNLVETFTYAINTPGATSQGTAFESAWDANKSDTHTSWNHDYIGSMVDDDSIASDLKNSFFGVTYSDENTGYSSYTIFIKYLTNHNECINDNSTTSHTNGYDIYLYKGSEYTANNNGYVENLYKTCVELQDDGRYVPVHSYVGSSELVKYMGSSTSEKSIDTSKYKVSST